MGVVCVQYEYYKCTSDLTSYFFYLKTPVSFYDSRESMYTYAYVHTCGAGCRRRECALTSDELRGLSCLTSTQHPTRQSARMTNHAHLPSVRAHDLASPRAQRVSERMSLRRRVPASARTRHKASEARVPRRRVKPPLALDRAPRCPLALAHFVQSSEQDFS